jgi:hypothetical protein
MGEKGAAPDDELLGSAIHCTGAAPFSPIPFFLRVSVSGGF